MKRLAILQLILISCFCINSFTSRAQYFRKNIDKTENNLVSPPGDTIHAIHYDINLLSIDFTSHQISAFTTVRLVPKINNISEFSLELINLSVDSVFLNGQMTGNFYQGDSLISLHLDSPAGIEDTMEVTMYYHGVPFHEDWGGFHFSNDYAFNLGVGISFIPHNLGKSWFPCIDDFTDRAGYDVSATVDQGYTAIGGGLLVDKTINGDGTITYHWHINHTIPTYLASIAIGDYTMISDTFQGQQQEVPVDIFVRPIDSSKVAGTFVHLKEVLSIFENLMGPYPWSRVGYTGTALGAMEHVSNIFIPNSMINGGTGNESILVHELSHMWVGDMVTCASPYEMWLNEGWAEFFGMYYAAILYNNYDLFKTSMRTNLADVMQFCHTPGGDGAYFPQNNIPQSHTYGMTAYNKGAASTQALRFYLGDSLFFGGLKAYLANFAYNSATSYDMRDFLTTYSGIDMNGFFDNWVFNPGTPHYSVDSFEVIPSGDQFQVSIHMKQKRKGGDFSGNDNIVELMFMSQDWQRFSDTVKFSGPVGTSVKMLPFAPVAIFPDPEEKMCDATTDSYKVFTSASEYTFPSSFFKISIEQLNDSAFIQAVHNWVPPDSLKQAVPGLRLSDYRYWTINGVIPQDFQASGSFFYTRNNYLDNTLILNQTDSLVILYRKDASEDWHSIPFSKAGIWSIGNLNVPNLQLGDYVLAVYDNQVGINEYQDSPGGKLEIFPNPSNGYYKIRCSIDEPATLRIFNISGRLIEEMPVYPEQKDLRWEPGNIAEGSYMLCLYSDDQKKLDWKKVLYLHSSY